jgi:uncharacterized Zn finger protein
VNNLSVGLPCPECGHTEQTITAWLYDAEGYHAGTVLHCNKCEHVFRDEWDNLYA